MTVPVKKEGRLSALCRLCPAKPREAVRLARSAIEAGKDDPDALWMAGWTLSVLGGEPDTAANVIDRALTINPNSAHAWMARGVVSLIQNRPDAAIEAVERAIRLSPLDPWGARRFTYLLASAHLAAGRYEEVIDWADRGASANRSKKGWRTVSMTN